MTTQILFAIAVFLIAIALITLAARIRKLEKTTMALSLIVGLGIDMKGKTPGQVTNEVIKGLENYADEEKNAR